MSTLKVISLGNDIIDLTDPDSVKLSENTRFLSRVYNSLELESIFNNTAKDKDKLLWKVWAAKEAAYKALKRCNPTLFFSPSKFVFHEDSSTITHNEYTVDIEYLEAPESIHAAAYLNKEKFSFEPVLKIAEHRQIESALAFMTKPLVLSYSRESSLCRSFAIQELQKYFNTPDVEIRKKEGRQAIPEIFIQSQSTPHLLSLSHHGRYCAILFCQI